MTITPPTSVAVAGCGGGTTGAADTATSAASSASSAAEGTEEGAEEATEGGTIAVITVDPANPYWKAEVDTAVAKAEELGYETTVNAHENDADLQNQFIDAAISQEVVAIILDPAGADESVGAVQKATKLSATSSTGTVAPWATRRVASPSPDPLRSGDHRGAQSPSALPYRSRCSDFGAAPATALITASNSGCVDSATSVIAWGIEGRSRACSSQARTA